MQHSLKAWPASRRRELQPDDPLRVIGPAGAVMLLGSKSTVIVMVLRVGSAVFHLPFVVTLGERCQHKAFHLGRPDGFPNSMRQHRVGLLDGTAGQWQEPLRRSPPP